MKRELRFTEITALGKFLNCNIILFSKVRRLGDIGFGRADQNG